MAKQKIDTGVLDKIGNQATHHRNENASEPKKDAKTKKKPELYLGGPSTVVNGRIDLDKKLHKTLKNLGNSTTTTDNKVVSIRRLMTEALVDLFEKYQKGEGKYPFDTDEDWSWLKQK